MIWRVRSGKFGVVLSIGCLSTPLDGKSGILAVRLYHGIMSHHVHHVLTSCSFMLPSSHAFVHVMSQGRLQKLAPEHGQYLNLRESGI